MNQKDQKTNIYIRGNILGVAHIDGDEIPQTICDESITTSIGYKTPAYVTKLHYNKGATSTDLNHDSPLPVVKVTYGANYVKEIAKYPYIMRSLVNDNYEDCVVAQVNEPSLDAPLKLYLMEGALIFRYGNHYAFNAESRKDVAAFLMYAVKGTTEAAKALDALFNQIKGL